MEIKEKYNQLLDFLAEKGLSNEFLFWSIAKDQKAVGDRAGDCKTFKIKNHG